MGNILVCTPCSRWGKFLAELLERDLKNSVHYSITNCSKAELMQLNDSQTPHGVVCDLNDLPHHLACLHLQYLRNKFPNSGLVVAIENESIEEMADKMGVYVVYSVILRNVIHYPKGSRRFLEAAQVAVRNQR